jgi:hypothetical protein
MTAFCVRVGTTGDYGCRPVKGGRCETPDHCLPISAPLFDTRPELRAEVKKAEEQARVLIEVRAMAAMSPAEKRPWKSKGP